MVGAAVGAVGGALTFAGAGAVAGVAGAAKVAVAAGMGAATTTSCQILSDGVDLAISEGWAGEHLQKNVIAAKTKDEFSAPTMQFSWGQLLPLELAWEQPCKASPLLPAAMPMPAHSLMMQPM